MLLPPPIGSSYDQTVGCICSPHQYTREPGYCIRSSIPFSASFANNMSEMEEHVEPLHMTNEEGNGYGEKDNYFDTISEDNNPKIGRPGIVVFSGGTAFNAASAEMASRNVGGDIAGLVDRENISRSNSISSLIDLLGGMGESEANNANLNNIAGGTKVWHVLPVTDDGGSTAEIVRVLGGPAVGDIRSRLLRLAPGTTNESRAVLRLLGHRLVSMSSLEKNDGDDNDEVTHEKVSRMARGEWLDILDGGQPATYQQSYNLDNYNDNGVKNQQQSYEHPLWKGVSAPYRSIIRAFLVHFHNQVLQTHNGIRQSQSHPPFDFTGGSVGNFFFAGARTFFGSLSAAIFLFNKVAGIPSGSRVVPAVVTEERLVLGAELRDGTRIRGQYSISHPQPKPPSTPQHDTKQQSSNDSPRKRSGSENSVSRHRQVVKSSLDSKEAISSLHQSPISKMTYLLHDPTWQRRQAQNPVATQQQWSDRHVISPEPNSLVLDAISNANCIAFGCGSLFTSVLPSLVLEGVGFAISRRNVPKVLLLNGWHDCETSWAESSATADGEHIVKKMDATAIVKAVVDALDQGEAYERIVKKLDATAFVEAIVDASDQGEVYAAGSDEVDDNDAADRHIPLVTDYITHIFYPVGTEIDIDELSLANFCAARRQQGRGQECAAIQVRGIESIPADTCSEGSKSGGQSHHRVFDPRALVSALLDLTSGV